MLCTDSLSFGSVTGPTRPYQGSAHQLDTRLESIDFPDSNSYYVIETSLSYQAAMAQTFAEKMTEHSTLEPGDKVVALSSLARAVGVVSALAAAICYQVAYGVPDFLTILTLFAPALVIGVIVGWLVSLQFVSGGRDGNTTVVKHGRDGAPVTVRAALFVAIPIAVIFILIVRFGLGFDGNLVGLVATIAIPAILAAVVWALLGSLA